MRSRRGPRRRRSRGAGRIGAVLARFLAPERALEGGVEPTLCDELVVRALLDDTALIHDHDEIGIANRGEPVGDHERGAPLHQLRDAALDQRLRLGIDVGGRLVEDEHLGVAEQGARERDQLALSGREVRPALADLDGQGRRACPAPGQRPVEPDPTHCVIQLRLGVVLAEGDVLRERPREQDDVLRHDRDPLAQLRDGQLADVRPAEPDRAAVALVQPRQELDHGRLPRATVWPRGTRRSIPRRTSSAP